MFSTSSIATVTTMISNRTGSIPATTTTAYASIAKVASANGNGAMAKNVASTSEYIVDSNAPVDWRRCHNSGSSDSRRVSRNR